MGAGVSTLGGQSWQELLMQPKFLGAAALVVASAAIVFLGLLGPKKLKGTYSIPVKGAPRAKNESETRRHRTAPDRDMENTPAWPTLKTLHDVLEIANAQRPNNQGVAVRPLIKIVKETTKVHGVDKVWEYPQLGPYQWYTYGELHTMVAHFGSALQHIGLKFGENLGIFEETRLEWTVAAHSAWRQGCVILTVYANLGEEALEYALGLGEVTTLLMNGKSLGVITSAKKVLPHLKTLIVVDEVDATKLAAAKAAGLTVYSYTEFLELGKTHLVPPRAPKPTDLATIMFTSGTTGLPKGVTLTHGQTVGAMSGAEQVLISLINITEKDTYVSYLPLAHILALVVQSALFTVGVRIGFGSPRSLTDASVRECKGDLREFEPTLFVGVPTVFERIKAGVERKLRASAASSAIFNFAFSLKKQLVARGLPTFLLDLIVFNKLKREMGGKVRAMVSGGAALSQPVNEFIEICFGCRLLQGYGLTETCGPACVQEHTDLTLGSVGSPMPSIRIKLVDVPQMGYLHTSNPPRGEIWFSGSNVSSGYYKNKEETEKAFVDGWFRTGDVGELAPNGTYRIIDRIKNLIKPPHGEYVALESIESRYRNCQYVEHICAYVDSTHNEVVAVVVPKKLEVEGWAQKNGVDFSDYGLLCANPTLNAVILKSLQDTARQYKLKSFEVVKAIYITPDEWTPDNDLLTAAQKLKRNQVVAKYRAQIDALYTKFTGSNE